MNTVNVEQFFSQVAPYCDGAPKFSIERAVSDTVIAMCQETQCVVTELCFDTKPGESTYNLSVGDGLDVEMVRAAYCDSYRMEPRTLDDLAQLCSPLDWRDSEGMPIYYTFQKRNRIILAPVPKEERRIRVIAAVTIERGGRNIPEIFYTDYLDTVVDGALSRLYRTAGQGYSNFRLGAEYEARYQAGLQSIRVDSYRNFTRTSGRVAYNRWAD